MLLKFFNQPYRTPFNKASKYKPETEKVLATQEGIASLCVTFILFFPSK